MTVNFENDTCSDPFNPIDNHLETECQAASYGKNGLFPARFCVKISGIIVDVDLIEQRACFSRSTCTCYKIALFVGANPLLRIVLPLILT